MKGLPNGRKSFKIGLAVETQYRRVTDRRTEAQADTARRKERAMQSVARVKSNTVSLLSMTITTVSLTVNLSLVKQTLRACTAENQGRTDRWTDGRTDRRTDRPAEKPE